MSRRVEPARPLRSPGLLRALLLGAALAAGVAAQPAWVSLDGSPAGTPAEVSVLPGPSSDVRTSVEVRVHGFWREDVLGGDGQTYQRLDFPGLETMTEPGEPELPRARLRLGLATDASQVTFITAQTLAQQVVAGLDVYPTPIPGEDEEFDPSWDTGSGDTEGSAEQWVLDAGVYGSSGPWPPAAATGGPVSTFMARVPGADVTMHPVSWDPATGDLVVKTEAVFLFDHFGADLPQVSMTRLAEKALATDIANWPEITGAYFAEDAVYSARYLIIANVFWWDTLEPFVELKQMQGFEVTVDTALADLAAVKQAIAQWYALGDPAMDHYVLLVGDIDQIPMEVIEAEGGEAVATDDVYGDVAGEPGFWNAIVGRLSVDGEADLANQLAKLIAYQASPPVGADYGRALLVANLEEAPGKYTGSHEAVRTFPYNSPPAFMTAYGAYGATSAQVSTFIDNGFLGDGLGFVAYRGHGSSRTWSAWNVDEESYWANDVMFLDNDVHPVVWSIACTNADLAWTDPGLTQADSIAEVWMEVGQGAVASYAATRTTSTTPNHHLNEVLFQRVFHDGITTHGWAIASAEASVWQHWPGHKNSWAYLLLGDPSMILRTETPEALTIEDLPISLSMDDPADEIPATITDASGATPEGLVTFYKPSFLEGHPPETLTTWWIEEGETYLDYDFATPGTLYVTARDLHGNQSTVEVEVEMGEAWTDAGHGMPGAEHAPRLAATGQAFTGSPLQFLLADAPPLATAFLCMGLSVANVPLKGGVLVPNINPGAIIALPTDADGNIVIPGAWPGTAPSGAQMVLQYWMADPTGPAGFIASNGIIATAP